MKQLLFLTLALILTGCTSINVSHEGGHTMVDIANTGWYLFNIIPLASGDPDTPEDDYTCNFFDDTVNLEGNMKLLAYAIRQNNALGAKEIISYVTEENILFILAKHRVLRTSAELIPQTELIPDTSPCESALP